MPVLVSTTTGTTDTRLSSLRRHFSSTGRFPCRSGSVLHRGRYVPLNPIERDQIRGMAQALRMRHQATPAFQIILEVLLSFVGRDGRCDPSHATIARASGFHVSTVREALAFWKRVGVLDWDRRKLSIGVQTTSQFRFSVLPADALAHLPARPFRDKKASKNLLLPSMVSRSNPLPQPVPLMDQAEARADLAAIRDQMEQRLIASTVWRPPAG